MDELEEAKIFVTENGAACFVPDQSHYEFDRSKGNVLLIALTDIAPVRRDRTPRFDVARGRDILDGFQSGSRLPQILVFENDDSSSTHLYKLYDGFHRLYLSHAVGYLSIAVEVVPDNRNLFADFRGKHFGL